MYRFSFELLLPMSYIDKCCTNKEGHYVIFSLFSVINTYKPHILIITANLRLLQNASLHRLRSDLHSLTSTTLELHHQNVQNTLSVMLQANYCATWGVRLFLIGRGSVTSLLIIECTQHVERVHRTA